MTLKACKVRRAWGNPYDLESWKRHPVYRYDQGFAIDKTWAICRHDVLEGWAVIHRVTGFAASDCVPSEEAAQALVNALYEKFGRDVWNFTNPEAVREMRGAKAVVRQYELEG